MLVSLGTYFGYKGAEIVQEKQAKLKNYFGTLCNPL
jgi:hypothetical protein